MARPRSFDPATVIARARDAFVVGGYRGTSVDDLLTATGLARASLYQAFGSKRGLFLAALTRAPGGPVDLDLLMVALMDLAGDDAEIRSVAGRLVDSLGSDVAGQLGARLLSRGLVITSPSAGEDPS